MRWIILTKKRVDWLSTTGNWSFVEALCIFNGMNAKGQFQLTHSSKNTWTYFYIFKKTLFGEFLSWQTCPNIGDSFISFASSRYSRNFAMLVNYAICWTWKLGECCDWNDLIRNMETLKCNVNYRLMSSIEWTSQSPCPKSMCACKPKMLIKLWFWFEHWTKNSLKTKTRVVNQTLQHSGRS